MFSFDAEYVDAAKFGAENKLDVPFLIPAENRILNDEDRKQISELFIHYSGISARSWERRITGQCVAAHFLLMDNCVRKGSEFAKQTEFHYNLPHMAKPCVYSPSLHKEHGS